MNFPRRKAQQIKHPALAAYLRFAVTKNPGGQRDFSGGVGWGPILLTMGCFLGANAFLAVIPLVIGKLTGDITAAHIHRGKVLEMMWILVGLSVAHMVTWRLSELVYLRHMKPLSYRYEKLVFSAVVNKPYPYFVDKLTGKVASYVNSIQQVMEEFTENLPYNYMGQFVSIVAVVAILASVNWQTTVIYVGGMVALFFVGRYLQRAASAAERSASDLKATKNGIIFDAVANFANVKSFHRENHEIALTGAGQRRAFAGAQVSFLASWRFWGGTALIVRLILWPAAIILNVNFYLEHRIDLTQLATLLSAILIFTTTIWESIWFLSELLLQVS